MYRADVEQIIKWATRCLYLEIALFVFVSSFYLNCSFTFPFLGAILGMFYLHLIWSKERFKTVIVPQYPSDLYKEEEREREKKKRE